MIIFLFFLFRDKGYFCFILSFISDEFCFILFHLVIIILFHFSFVSKVERCYGQPFTRMIQIKHWLYVFNQHIHSCFQYHLGYFCFFLNMDTCLFTNIRTTANIAQVRRFPVCLILQYCINGRILIPHHMRCTNAYRKHRT